MRRRVWPELDNVIEQNRQTDKIYRRNRVDRAELALGDRYREIGVDIRLVERAVLKIFFHQSVV